MHSRQHFRSVFVSDIHLGLRDCRAGLLLRFLRTVSCEHLYLVGDIIDFENLARAPYWHADHGAVVAELLALGARGARIVYIPGNHDALLRRFAGASFAGVDIALDAIHVAADGRRYRVSHGDEFDAQRQTPAWLHRVGDCLQRVVCALNRHVNALRRALGLGYLPVSVAIKRRVGGARRYIDAFESCVAAAARADGVDGHICGHIHYGRVAHHAGVAYLNDGDWVEHCTALVEHGDGRFELLHPARRDELGAAAASSPDRPLPAAA